MPLTDLCSWYWVPSRASTLLNPTISGYHGSRGRESGLLLDLSMKLPLKQCRRLPSGRRVTTPLHPQARSYDLARLSSILHWLFGSDLLQTAKPPRIRNEHKLITCQQPITTSKIYLKITKTSIDSYGVAIRRFESSYLSNASLRFPNFLQSSQKEPVYS
ncbi:hypothetical protein BDD12DRAFT_169957 [Trichophaea hybrida]|nr:hypothetical protein BDD12DRAFT_169957 [Trichophaea hybrida]